MNIRIAAFSLVFASLFMATGAAAQSMASWQQATPVHFLGESAVIYGRLATQGQATMYRLAVNGPTTERVELAVPTSVNPDFSPRLVVFQPDSTTIGPPLPMEQPPNTIATVYPALEQDTNFDVFTQINYRQALQTGIHLDRAGIYYIALYNPSIWSGRYRLTVDHGQASTASWADAWSLPSRWWMDQAFAGWTWRTLLTPLLLVILGILAVEQLRFYHLHHLAPAPKAAPRRIRKTKARKKKT